MTAAEILNWWQILEPGEAVAVVLAWFIVGAYLWGLVTYLRAPTRSQRARFDADRPHAWRGSRWYNRNN